jgi:radical SAM enzyme (rSAM/lipoprotein system)
MPAGDFLRVIDEITPYVNPNKLLIIFTGGEALLREDLEYCGMELYRRGFPWGVVTNGLNLTRQRLDSLTAAGLHTMTVSLDGFEKEHNWMRNHPKSFLNASEAIKMLVNEKEIIWDVVTCVNPSNYDTIQQFRDYLISLGVKRWRLFSVFPAGRAAHDNLLILSDNQFKGLMEFIAQTRKEGLIKASYGCEGFLGGYESEVRDSFYFCQAGISAASVLADGSISGCPSIRSNFYQGNIYKDSLADVWENRFEKYRDRSWAQTGICENCKQFRYCLGNGMHLRDEKDNLMFCHYQKISSTH